MSRIALAFALALAALGCAAQKPTPARVAPVPDAALGLAKGSVFEVPAPPPYKESDASPGEVPPLPRAFPGAPPLIPHDVSGYHITRKDNDCAECHSVKEKEKGQPTPMPASHYTDLRNAPGRVGEAVAGARWVCTACHVGQTDARPLVGNRFGSPQ
jgi:cytochrome c-type protein NapB